MVRLSVHRPVGPTTKVLPPCSNAKFMNRPLSTMLASASAKYKPDDKRERAEVRQQAKSCREANDATGNTTGGKRARARRTSSHGGLAVLQVGVVHRDRAELAAQGAAAAVVAVQARAVLDRRRCGTDRQRDQERTRARERTHGARAGALRRRNNRGWLAYR